jgi:dolichyl-diphosphooligosaccharide---protein glycosyltransferase
MSSTEEVAYPILRKHDVDYVLVIFGGVLGYSGDDINKFLWMVRISQGIWPDEIQEPWYFTPQGEYRVDDQASPAMRNSLMYKMSYYRCVGNRLYLWGPGDNDAFAFSFSELFGGGPAQDRVRGQMIPSPGPTLDYLGEYDPAWPRCNQLTDQRADEAFTSENWIVSCLAQFLKRNS